MNCNSILYFLHVLVTQSGMQFCLWGLEFLQLGKGASQGRYEQVLMQRESRIQTRNRVALQSRPWFIVPLVLKPPC